MNKIMECQMCLKSVDVLKKSHIVPRAMHMNTKNEKGRNYLSLTGSNYLNGDNQSDLKEKLFCEFCEGILNSFETPALKVLDNISSNKNNKIDKSEARIVQKFVRSIFWRASISKKCKFKFGLKSEDLLRRYILESAFVLDEIYAVQVSKIQSIRNIANTSRSLLIEPWTLDTTYGICGYFSSGGLLYTLIFNKINDPWGIKTLDENIYQIKNCNYDIDSLIKKELFHIQSKAKNI